MPTILRWGPYRAFFYSNERGKLPHIHVRSGDFEAKFWLHDLSVAVNARFPAHEIGAIIRHLRSQRDLLEGKWHEHFWKLTSVISGRSRLPSPPMNSW